MSSSKTPAGTKGLASDMSVPGSLRNNYDKIVDIIQDLAEAAINRTGLSIRQIEQVDRVIANLGADLSAPKTSLPKGAAKGAVSAKPAKGLEGFASTEMGKSESLKGNYNQIGKVIKDLADKAVDRTGLSGMQLDQVDRIIHSLGSGNQIREHLSSKPGKALPAR